MAGPARERLVHACVDANSTDGSTAELAHRRANGLGERNAEFFIDFKGPSARAHELGRAFCRIGNDVAQSPQCLGFTAPVTEVPGKGQGLGVVLACLAVLTDEPLNLAQPPQRRRAGR